MYSRTPAVLDKFFGFWSSRIAGCGCRGSGPSHKRHIGESIVWIQHEIKCRVYIYQPQDTSWTAIKIANP